MQMIDFEYNGEKLSDRGLMLCNFDGTSDEVEVGNAVSINKVRTPNSNKSMAVGYSYDDDFSRPFSICKNVCNGNDDLVISKEFVIFKSPASRHLIVTSQYKCPISSDVSLITNAVFVSLKV